MITNQHLYYEALSIVYTTSYRLE